MIIHAASTAKCDNPVLQIRGLWPSRNMQNFATSGTTTTKSRSTTIRTRRTTTTSSNSGVSNSGVSNSPTTTIKNNSLNKKNEKTMNISSKKIRKNQI